MTRGENSGNRWVAHDSATGSSFRMAAIVSADAPLGRSRLEAEPAETLRISAHFRSKHLDRDIAAEPRIVGAVDLAHAAGIEHGKDFVRTETARGQRHW